MNNVISVGISDMKIVKAPDVLVTYALGSCVGICLYDPVMRVAGLAHILLPNNKNDIHENKLKYADSSIPLMIEEMIACGCNKHRLVAKIMGGANMFKISGDSNIGSIGSRNVVSTKNVLKELCIPITAEDTGADYGRTVWFYSESGSVEVKSYNNKTKNL